ncbi:hypothetical protein HDV00_005814 [Rhizophlyctis rosea]|nr:hypothetical protein HDV00_005814 [Rhizophlyctis rosea]
MSSSSDTNYAAVFGLSSTVAAIVFAVVYVPLFFLSVFRAVRRFSYLWFLLSVFTAARVVAFALRAYLIKDGTNFVLYIVYTVFYGIGAIVLLTAIITLLATNARTNANRLPNLWVEKFPRVERLLRLVIVALIAISIWASTMTGHSDKTELQKNVNTGVYAAITAIAAIAVLISLSLIARVRTGILFAILIAALLILVRAAFYLASQFITYGIPSPIPTIPYPYNMNPQGTHPTYDERLWYPLAATTELLALLLVHFALHKTDQVIAAETKQESVSMHRRF